MPNTITPTIHTITRQAGIAGQFSVTAEVEYPGEGRQAVKFYGSTYGGPVVMETRSIDPHLSLAQTFVTDPGRFGEFGVKWVRRFFGVEI